MCSGRCSFVGLAIVPEKWALLADDPVVLVPLQMLRARKEEQVLAEAFGEEYVRYKAGRGSGDRDSRER